MKIIMPKLGLTMTHGTISEWLKAPGDAVKAEEALCVYETEKVTLELTAPEDGVLTEILAPAGATVPAGEPVCEFRTRSEGQGSRARDQEPAERVQMPLSGARPETGASATETSVPGTAGHRIVATPKARGLARQLGVDLAAVAGSGPEGRVQAGDVQSAYAAGRPAPETAGHAAPGSAGHAVSVKATPLARRMAESKGVDLRSIAGTGPEGIITREDVEQAAARQGSGIREQEPEVGTPKVQATDRSSFYVTPVATPLSPAGTLIPHTTLRRTIADHMSRSAFTAPHVTLMTEAEATNLVSARAQLNQELPAEEKISYNTLLAALVARALREHPGVNACWEADGIRRLAEINIALAVDTERGLMTPVLPGVDKLSLAAVQRGYGDLIGRALAGKSLPGDFAGGTFTITNLGGLDVDGFTPIINPPQAAILGVGRIVEKPVAREGAVVVRPMLTLSLSFDHRIVDGGPAAKFLQRVKQLVERPMALVLG